MYRRPMIGGMMEVVITVHAGYPVRVLLLYRLVTGNPQAESFKLVCFRAITAGNKSGRATTSDCR